MIVKIPTVIVLEVEDENEAVAAVQTVDRELEGNINRHLGWPHGTIVDISADNYEEVSEAEAEEQGWTE